MTETRELRRKHKRAVRPAGLALVLNTLVALLAAEGLNWLLGSLGLDPAAYRGPLNIATALLAFALTALPMRGPGALARDLTRARRPMRLSALLWLLVMMMGVQGLTGVLLTMLEMLLSLFGLSLIPQQQLLAEELNQGYWGFLYLALGAPAIEEALFRGAVLGWLRPRGRASAVVASALLFGAMHGNVSQAVMASMLGMLLGYVALEYGVKWAFILHGLNNLLLAALPAALDGYIPGAGAVTDALLLFVGVPLMLLRLVRHQEGVRAFFLRLAQESPSLRWTLTSGWVIAHFALHAFAAASLFFV